MNSVDEQVEQLHKEIADRYEEINRLRSLPAEPVVGSVVKFTKRLRGSRDYDYAGINTPAGWYLTGETSRRRYTWVELNEFADGAEILVCDTFPDIKSVSVRKISSQVLGERILFYPNSNDQCERYETGNVVRDDF